MLVPLLVNLLWLMIYWLPGMKCCDFYLPCQVPQISLNPSLTLVPVPPLLNLLWLTIHGLPDTKRHGLYPSCQVPLNLSSTWVQVPLLLLMNWLPNLMMS